MSALSILEVTKRVLDETAENLLTKGYFRLPDMLKYGLKLHDLPVPEPTLRKFARKLAREHNRPFIEIDPHNKWVWPDPLTPGCRPEWRPAGIRIFMKKQKQLAPLIIPLEQAGFQSGRYSSRWCYYIDDAEFAQAYLNLFETNEQFRKVLRLPH